MTKKILSVAISCVLAGSAMWSLSAAAAQKGGQLTTVVDAETSSSVDENERLHLVFMRQEE